MGALRKPVKPIWAQAESKLTQVGPKLDPSTPQVGPKLDPIWSKNQVYRLTFDFCRFSAPCRGSKSRDIAH